MCNSNFLNLENSRQNLTENPMTVSSYHILQEGPNNLTRILLARTYPSHLIIKNIKKALIYTPSNFLFNRHNIQKQSFCPLIAIQRNCLLLPGHLSFYLPTPNPAAFRTILSSPHKHMAHHNTIP